MYKYNGDTKTAILEHAIVIVSKQTGSCYNKSFLTLLNYFTYRSRKSPI